MSKKCIEYYSFLSIKYLHSILWDMYCLGLLGFVHAQSNSFLKLSKNLQFTDVPIFLRHPVCIQIYKFIFNIFDIFGDQLQSE